MKRLFHIFFLFFFLLTIVINVQAQRKEISQARQWVKHGINLDKAENSMTGLLKDTTNRNNKKIWLTLFEAVKTQYAQGNEKLYLKQNYDTAKLFSLGKKMFDVLQAFDSVDAKPNRKGVIKIEYRDEHAQFLNQIRPNLFNGGAYFMLKHKYQEAYNLSLIHI